MLRLLLDRILIAVAWMRLSGYLLAAAWTECNFVSVQVLLRDVLFIFLPEVNFLPNRKCHSLFTAHSLFVFRSLQEKVSSPNAV